MSSSSSADIESSIQSLTLLTEDSNSDQVSDAVESTISLAQSSPDARLSLAERVAVTAVESCQSFISYQSVLSVLVGALLAEVKSNERSSSTVSGLAFSISYLIAESGKANEMKLLVQAKKELNIRSNTVSKAFANVDGKPSQHAKFLAKATEKESKSTAGGSRIHELEGDIVAKITASSGNDVHVGTAQQNLTDLESELVAMSQSDADKYGGGSNSDIFEDEPSNGRNSNNNSNDIALNTNSQANEGYKDPAPEDDDLSEDDDFPRPELHSVTTSARGLAGEPDVEYGQAQENLANATDDPESQLAVAVAVVPNEQETLIPAAIEYEPDSKPPLYRNRRFRLYGCLAAVLLLVIVVGAAVGMSMRGDSSQDATGGASGGANSNSEPATLPPTTAEEKAIIDIITSVVGEEKLSGVNSSHRKALDWILYEDPLKLTSNSENIVQRYILALFYISTTEDVPWLSCNRPTEEEVFDCEFQVLVDLFPEAQYQKLDLTRWLSKKHECEWAGILCNNDEEVEQVQLGGQKMRGTLPEEIAELTKLKSLSLWFNDLYGLLPPRLGELENLLNLELHYNFFEGAIPSEWFTRRWGVARLNLVGNLLTGTLPHSISQLPNIKGFFIYINELSGTIPTEIGDLSTLQYVRMGRNKWEGVLPTELGKLTELQELWIQKEEMLIGSIPSEIGQLSAMADLRLFGNKLTGKIPSEIYDMKNLNRLDLYENELSGTISTEVGKLEKLSTFRVKGNNFTGSIPTELGLLRLNSAWFHFNKFTGSMPEVLCQLQADDSLLEILAADCSPEGGSGDPRLPCDCCSSCCDPITRECYLE